MPAVAKTKSKLFAEWARAPKLGEFLHVPAGRAGIAVILEKEKGKRRDQMALMLKDAPEAVREAGIAAASNPGLGDIVIPFVISNDRVDSYDTTLAVDGWETKDYQNNPVVLYAHDSGGSFSGIGGGLPVGQDVGLHARKDALIGVTQFVSRELDPFGDKVGRFCAAGILRTTSVGFEPLEWKVNDERTDPDAWFPAIDFVRQRLREYSIVPVPANADCLIDKAHVDAMRAVGLDDADLVDLIERATETVGGLFVPRDELLALRAAVKGTRVQIDLGAGGSFAVAVDADDEARVDDAAAAPAADDKPADEKPADGTSMQCPMCMYEGTSADFVPKPKGDASGDGDALEADADVREVDGESKARHASEPEMTDDIMAIAEALADAVEEIEIEETGRLP